MTMQVINPAADRTKPLAFKNLKITRPSAATVTITADQLTLQDTNLAAKIISSVNVTANITTSGANGLDTGAEAANTIYYVWVIRKSSDGTVAALLSTSATSPTMPSGYNQKMLVSAVGNNNSSDFIDFIQEGLWYQFTTWATIASGNVGTGAWVAIDLTPANMSTVPGFVPPAISTLAYGSFANANASALEISNVNTQPILTGPNPNIYGHNGIISDSPDGWMFQILTADTLYWISQNAGHKVFLGGFYLNKLVG